MFGEDLRPFLIYAYKLNPTNYPSARIVIPPELESFQSPQHVQFDYINTMPQGGLERLQQVLKDQFGLVVRREMHSNLVLRVKTPGASGLHLHGTSGGEFDVRNVTMPALAKALRQSFGVNVTDATGLTNSYDYLLGFPRPATPDEIKRASRTNSAWN